MLHLQETVKPGLQFIGSRLETRRCQTMGHLDSLAQPPTEEHSAQCVTSMVDRPPRVYTSCSTHTGHSLPSGNPGALPESPPPTPW